MRHVEEAAMKMADGGNSNSRFIAIMPITKEQPNTIVFDIQSAPIGEVGVNGCQARDMIEYVLRLIESLDAKFPCIENQKTIEHLDNALNWQDQRTKDRERRKVEGKYEA